MGVFPSPESRGRLRIQARAQFSGVSVGDLWLYGPLSADQPSHHASSAVGRSACAESEQLSWTRLLRANDHPGRCLRAPRGDRSGPGAVHRDQLYRHVYPAFLWEVSSYCSLPSANENLESVRAKVTSDICQGAFRPTLRLVTPCVALPQKGANFYRPTCLSSYQLHSVFY